MECPEAADTVVFDAESSEPFRAIELLNQPLGFGHADVTPLASQVAQPAEDSVLGANSEFAGSVNLLGENTGTDVPGLEHYLRSV